MIFKKNNQHNSNISFIVRLSSFFNFKSPLFSLIIIIVLFQEITLTMLKNLLICHLYQLIDVYHANLEHQFYSLFCNQYQYFYLLCNKLCNFLLPFAIKISKYAMLFKLL